MAAGGVGLFGALLDPRSRQQVYGCLQRLFETEAIEVIKTPVRAPKANAFAERWIRTVRDECLDRLIVLDQRHLHYILTQYIRYYNCARPHQSIEQRTPIPVSYTHLTLPTSDLV